MHYDDDHVTGASKLAEDLKQQRCIVCFPPANITTKSARSRKRAARYRNFCARRRQRLRRQQYCISPYSRRRRRNNNKILLKHRRARRRLRRLQRQQKRQRTEELCCPRGYVKVQTPDELQNYLKDHETLKLKAQDQQESEKTQHNNALDDWIRYDFTNPISAAPPPPSSPVHLVSERTQTLPMICTGGYTRPPKSPRRDENWSLGSKMCGAISNLFTSTLNDLTGSSSEDSVMSTGVGVRATNHIMENSRNYHTNGTFRFSHYEPFHSLCSRVRSLMPSSSSDVLHQSSSATAPPESNNLLSPTNWFCRSKIKEENPNNSCYVARPQPLDIDDDRVWLSGTPANLQSPPQSLLIDKKIPQSSLLTTVINNNNNKQKLPVQVPYMLGMPYNLTI